MSYGGIGQSVPSSYGVTWLSQHLLPVHQVLSASVHEGSYRHLSVNFVVPSEAARAADQHGGHNGAALDLSAQDVEGEALVVDGIARPALTFCTFSLLHSLTVH